MTADGRVTLFDVPAGQSADGTTRTGSSMILAVSSASSQAVDVPVTVTAQAPTAASYGVQSAATLARSAATQAPPRRLLQTTAREVGSKDTFLINAGNSDPKNDHRQTATLRRIGAHAYFYVDDAAAFISDATFDDFVTTFDSVIYPRVTAAFGSEAQPGIDGDSRLFIVFSPAVHDFERDTDTFGYFWVPDASPQGGRNGKEVLFVSDVVFSRAPTLGKVTMAHELEHLINFTRKGPLLNYATNEEGWLDEGMAMLAMDLAGFTLASGEQLIATGIRAFQDAPSAYTLQDWGANPDGRAFGPSYLFSRYLVDRYGTGILSELIDNSQRGQEGVETVLARHGNTFVNFFREWVIANVFNDEPSSAGTRYRYNALKLKGTFGVTTLPGFKVERPTGAFTASLKPWSTRYYRFDGPPGTSWRVSLPGGAAGRVVAGAVAIP